MGSRIYWINGQFSGRLAIMGHPRLGGCLEDSVLSWRKEAIDIVVSLLELSEIEQLDLGREPEMCADHGIAHMSFPIRDSSVPKSFSATLDFIELLALQLQSGKSVAIHCWGGIGRSSLMGACTLVYLGEQPGSAFSRIGAARDLPVPETDEQNDWVRRFAEGVIYRNRL